MCLYLQEKNFKHIKCSQTDQLIGICNDEFLNGQYIGISIGPKRAISVDH